MDCPIVSGRLAWIFLSRLILIAGVPCFCSVPVVALLDIVGMSDAAVQACRRWWCRIACSPPRHLVHSRQWAQRTISGTVLMRRQAYRSILVWHGFDIRQPAPTSETCERGGRLGPSRTAL